MNILCVAAHGDDTEILCAGTLALYAKQGHQVTICVFTDGKLGDAKVRPEELGPIIEREVRASADVIGARLILPNILDEHVFPNEEQRRIMIDVLREADPDIIFTHSPTDYHPDHRYVGQLVFDSYFQKGLPFMPDLKKPASRFATAEIYYMDNICGINFTPTEYVDITETFEIKKQMLQCHKSQFASMDDLASTNLLDLIEVQSRFRGLAARCKYAEGFTRLNAYQRGIARRILP